ncbi:MAG: DUF1559 domain-containing protein [Isosphaeraceae bacterium]
MKFTTDSAFRKAITLPEIILSGVILFFILLLLISRLPRAREDSRSVSCISNLGQIGQAMLIYKQNQDSSLPMVSHWSGIDAKIGSSPFSAIRQDLKIGDFIDVRAQIESKKKDVFNPEPLRVAGLRCPSDRSESASTATNYRANTGVNARGESGPFSIGQVNRLNKIETADGLSFTAAFSERLIGDGTQKLSINNYLQFDICQEAVAYGVNGNSIQQDIKGDAGLDWSKGDWRNTLYHHGLTPNWRFSAIAFQDNCGQIGASSGHLKSVNVLLLDGSVRSWKDTVDPGVWKKLGGILDGTGP